MEDWQLRKINTGGETYRVTVIRQLPGKMPQFIAEPTGDDALDVGRLIAAAPRLERMLMDMIAVFGNPHPDDFADDGTSFKAAEDLLVRAHALIVEIMPEEKAP